MYINYDCNVLCRNKTKLKLLRNTKLMKAMDHDKITQERKTTKQTLTNLGDVERVREKN